MVASVFCRRMNQEAIVVESADAFRATTARVAALHREAMELAEEAAFERARGCATRADELLRAAFQKEREAAERFAGHVGFEPTRSVLFRSAASLALDCGDYLFAEELIARALAGNPPGEIEEELRALLERCRKEVADS